MESSQYEPPVRRSLSDEELAERVNQATASHNGMEAVMELLVAQEALRAQEDAEIEAWVEKMEADGSPQALAALAKFQGKDFIPQTDQFQYVQPEAVDLNEPESKVDEPEVSQTSEAESFSWLSDETVLEPQSIPEVVQVVEEIEIVTPVGSETEKEFETLISSSASEEEVTALEENQSTAPSNIVVPGDEHRNRKPLSQLLIWLGASSVLAPLLFGFALYGFGLSASAVILDIVFGYLLSGTAIGLSAMAGKRSGLSSATISRSIFGVWGNSLPLSFIALSRLVITTGLVAVGLALTNGWSAYLQPYENVLYSFAGLNISAGFVIGVVFLTLALVFVFLRGTASRIAVLVVSLGSVAGLLVALVGIIQQGISFTTYGTIGFISLQSLGAICLIAATTSLLWVSVAPNVSKVIPMKAKGLKVFLSVLAAHFLVPALVAIIAFGWLGQVFGTVTLRNPLGPLPVLLTGLPAWSQLALMLALVLGLFSMLLLSFKTAALDLHSLTRIPNRIWSTVLSWFLVVALLFWFTQQPSARTIEYLTNVLVLAGALSAGWVGIFVADVAVRKIAYHELSLNRAYGFYGKFNWLSLSIWLVSVFASVVLVPVNLMGFSFFGLVAPTIGLGADLVSQALALSMVIVLAAVLNLAIRIPQIRKQEQEVVAVESRREQLNDIFIGQE